MRCFLVQKCYEADVCGTIYTENELISFINMSDCSDEEYRIYDISVFGNVREVHFMGWKYGGLIEIADSNGNIIVSGYGTDH